ncbi:hypothetical protein A1Q2_03952 [Trichosporon asahii var. asahii CBS 8904]|uniref:Uncharacterized protein n=2 Tax=Trichosporon asahii var. asahii TaxID=189963 RepID=K1VCN4_TRIAC|nr:hypothetical protein A1Q1_08279 [Trichosporon asahii var. asahii CBS 2479]EJT50577.1 hypothetical protein A1Q1_08279 [Trichosporon asahii var. asahii CBS 2479]EKD01715.1 hypothetical protein A1Q2_03952 [Trichosporon asahii var. asahii CBS 8904]
MTFDKSTVKFSAYEGWGQTALKEYHYSQAVRVGDNIECSGQGEWLPSSVPPYPLPHSHSHPRVPSDRRHCLPAPSSASGKLTPSGGWDPQPPNAISEDVEAQIEQAFKNVELALKSAGGKGWSQVFRVRSYHLTLDDAAMDLMIANFRKWMPDHCPVWTCVEVTRLGIPGMKAEIEVVAHDPKN